MKVSTLSLVAAALLGLAQAAIAETKIGFVNSDRVMREAAPAVRAQQRLEKEFEKRDQELQRIARDLKSMQEDLERNGPTMADGDRRNKEFESTVTDLRILAHLALFHARRIPAAVNYRLFERTKDSKTLDEAIAHERSATEAWRQLVAAAGDFYTEDLMMGVRGANLCGHWKDEGTKCSTWGIQGLRANRNCSISTPD